MTERGVNRSFQTSVAQVVAATRLREVRALRGFTRLDSMPEAGDIEDVEELNISIAPISDKRRPSWLPAIDLRGEGVFLRLMKMDRRRQGVGAAAKWLLNRSVSNSAGTSGAKA